jgi:hypothetical protein
MKDLFSNIEIESMLDPIVSGNGTAAGALVMDLQGFNSALFIWHLGLAAATLDGSNYWTLKMEHAHDDGTGTDTAGTYADVSADDVQGVTPASGIVVTADAMTEDNLIYKIGYVGGRRFVRLTIAETGTGPNLPQSLIAIKGHPSNVPVA